jgi:hypothetical protein
LHQQCERQDASVRLKHRSPEHELGFNGRVEAPPIEARRGQPKLAPGPWPGIAVVDEVADPKAPPAGGPAEHLAIRAATALTLAPAHFPDEQAEVAPCGPLPREAADGGISVTATDRRVDAIIRRGSGGTKEKAPPFASGAPLSAT